MATEAPVLRQSLIDFGPEWVASEMPPGFTNRLEEIRRLTADLHEMGQFGRLLCDIGTPLADVVNKLFASMGFESSVTRTGACANVTVRLDAKSRLLLHISNDASVVQKKSPELAHIFQLLHETADGGDRVILVTNTEATKKPSERQAPVSADALAFLTRLGATGVTSATLFTLWKLTLQDRDWAKQQVRRLHTEESGFFQIAPSALA